MSNVIDFLERMGQDAQLRHADKDKVQAAMDAANVGASAARAMLGESVAALESVIGARPNVCCGLYPVDGEERVA